MSKIHYVKKMTGSVKSFWRIFIWSIFYIFAVWAILFFVFKFNIFNWWDWGRLFHAQIHSFAGFAFGILLLAAVPLYIATVTIIVRTHKPLFEVPNFIRKIFKAKIFTEKPSESEPTQPVEMPRLEVNVEEEKLPENIPAELRGAFIHNRKHENFYRIKAEQNYPNNIQKNTNKKASEKLEEEGEIETDFPLPTDFDLTDKKEEEEKKPKQKSSFPDEMPKFKTIKFDED